jgi:hypothetical protein
VTVHLKIGKIAHGLADLGSLNLGTGKGVGVGACVGVGEGVGLGVGVGVGSLWVVKK